MGRANAFNVRQHAQVRLTPRSRSLACRAGVAALFAIFALQNVGHAQSQRLVLFSSTEAAQLRMGADDWPHRPRLRAVAVGPRIIFKRPEVQQMGEDLTVRLTTPGALRVLFEPNRAAVDMRTLDVTARKSLFSKSLTAMLSPYVRGTSLEVDELVIPAGQFLIEVTIADVQGAQTTASYRFDVTGK